MKIEAGKYYKNRAGEVLGPMTDNHDDVYPFICQADGRYRSYTVDGIFYVNHRGDDDIIEECNADGSPIEPVENHLGTASWETTFDKQRRVEIALQVLPILLADLLQDVRAGFLQAEVGKSDPQWNVVAKEAFAVADEFIKVAKQS